MLAKIIILLPFEGVIRTFITSTKGLTGIQLAGINVSLCNDSLFL